mgnify:CR=1 FL=1
MVNKKLFLVIFFLSLCAINFAQRESIDSTIAKWSRQYKANPTQATSHVSYSNTQLTNKHSAGDYFIKGSNKILSGMGCQLVAGIVCIASNSYTANEIKNFDHPESNPDLGDIQRLENIQRGVNIGCGVLAFLGTGLEMWGVLNYRKAGVVLNENGIGVKIKF